MSHQPSDSELGAKLTQQDEVNTILPTMMYSLQAKGLCASRPSWKPGGL